MTDAERQDALRVTVANREQIARDYRHILCAPPHHGADTLWAELCAAQREIADLRAQLATAVARADAFRAEAARLRGQLLGDDTDPKGT